MRLAVDDRVVYGSHGVGRVATRQKHIVILEFERGLSVTLPVARAVECVRPVSTEIELAAIGRVLGDHEVASGENWQRRLKTTRGKVAGGDATSLAEVVRDARRREERGHERKEPSRLSVTERQLYLTARKLLADEIGAARGVDPESADAWIDDRLAQHRGQDPSGNASGPLASVTAPVAVEATSSGRRARRRRH